MRDKVPILDEQPFIQDNREPLDRLGRGGDSETVERRMMTREMPLGQLATGSRCQKAALIGDVRHSLTGVRRGDAREMIILEVRLSKPVASKGFATGSIPSISQLVW